MNFKQNIYILCGHPRCGKTSFAQLINLYTEKYINTALESLLRSNSTRYIFKEDNKKKELINYFYSKRFEGNNRDKKYALADYFDKKTLNKLISDFKTSSINFSQIIVEMKLKYSNLIKKDLILLDLNSEFYIEKYFKKKKITLLFFTRNYQEIIYEVIKFRRVSHYQSNFMTLVERTYLTYYVSNLYINKISKKDNVNVKIVDFNKFAFQDHNTRFEKEFNLNSGLLKEYFGKFAKEYLQIDDAKLKNKIKLFDKIEKNKINLFDKIRHPIFFLKFYAIILIFYISPKNIISYINIVYSPFKFFKNIFNQSKMFIRDNF